MSDGRSAIYGGKATAQPFAATLKSVDATLIGVRPKTQSAVDLLEEAKVHAAREGRRQGKEQGKLEGFAQGLEQGKKQGFEQAFREGSENQERELAELVQALNTLTDRFQREIDRWFQESETKIADLAMTAVRKMLAAELTLSRDSALDIAKEALADVTHSRHARIRVNPFDSVILRDRRQELLNAGESLRDIEIVSDSSLLGGCVIETDGGVVDASIETKLDLMEESFRRAA